MSITAYDLSDGREPISHEELNYLAKLAEGLPTNPLIVNIGAADGLSTMIFLATRPDALIYSVDIDECPQEYEHLEQAGLDRNRVIRFPGKSQDIGKIFPLQCDLLFIDGDHWTAGEDLEVWVGLGRVKEEGIIALHDMIVPPNPENNPGSVYQDVMAWKRDNPQYRQIGWVDRVIAFRA